jgi:hypothetical protein
LPLVISNHPRVCSFAPSQTDVELFNALGHAPDAKAYPNVSRYYSHIASFSGEARAKWPKLLSHTHHAAAAAPASAGAGAHAHAKAAPAPAAAADDDDAGEDLFGDDDEKVKEVVQKSKVRAELLSVYVVIDTRCLLQVAAPTGGEDKPKKKAKEPVIAKTSLVYEVCVFSVVLA